MPAPLPHPGRYRTITGLILLTLASLTLAAAITSGWYWFCWSWGKSSLYLGRGVIGLHRQIAHTDSYFAIPADLASTTRFDWLYFGVGTRDWHFPAWLPALALAITGYLTLRAGLTARRRARTDHCPHCGYHLKGLPTTTPCPECGKPRAA